MTQCSRDQPFNHETNLAKCRSSRWTVVLHSKLEHLWRINGEKASLLLPGLSLAMQLVLSFYFKIGEPRSPDCNDKKNSLFGTKRKCLSQQQCSLCHGVTPWNSPRQHTNQLQFSTAAFELCPLYCFRKDT